MRSTIEENVEAWEGLGSLPPLYSKTAKGAANVWWCWVDGQDVVGHRVVDFVEG